ncbi:MAG TPA: ribulose-phosphate 3-epimerase [Clostridia bacterium]|nr:ribulose-phosphate 3-epimerase [Clostridia bacterium]
MIIAPSILSADFSRLGEEILALEKAGADWIHFDVMDGQFVPNISFGSKILEDIKALTNLPFDVHLMVKEPYNYLEDFVKKGADSITFHIEAVSDPYRYIKKCRELGIKVGLSISPDTAVAEINPFLDKIDLVLVMSVYPGFGGQKFISSSLEKIQELEKLRKTKGYSFLIEVDGGVGPSNAKEISSAGADILVAGTSILASKDYKISIEQLR